eukprot:jgi/Mesen1/8628/ME000050S08040
MSEKKEEDVKQWLRVITQAGRAGPSGNGANTVSFEDATLDATLIDVAILRFYLAFGDEVLHDADKSLHTFFRACLTRWALPWVPLFYPVLLKLLACGGPSEEDAFVRLMPALIGPSSFLPLFPSLLDLPALMLALEDLEKTAGALPGAAPSAAPRAPSPQDLFALMDAGFIGGAAAGGGASGTDSEDESAAWESGRNGLRALYRELLKDENEGLAQGHWSKPGLQTALSAAAGAQASPQVKRTLRIVPRLLAVYFQVALRDVSDVELMGLLPAVFERIDRVFSETVYQQQVQKICVQAVLAAICRSPHIVAVLKKPIIKVIGQPFGTPAKAELALHLCLAVGECGGGGDAHKDAARQLFECLELLLYENLAASAAAARRVAAAKGPNSGRDDSRPEAAAYGEESGEAPSASESSCMGGYHGRQRLLCFVITAITKLAVWHKELNPRARVCLAKVARSQQVLGDRVWRRARDYLAVMRDPALSVALLGPSRTRLTGGGLGLGGSWVGSFPRAQRAPAPDLSLPFFLLRDKQGLPFHDFSLTDVLGSEIHSGC